MNDVLDQVRAGTIALGQAGAGTVETNGHGDLRVTTPFLQLVLTRLWEEERRSDSHTLRPRPSSGSAAQSGSSAATSRTPWPSSTISRATSRPRSSTSW